jgi:TolA-binding protein
MTSNGDTITLLSDANLDNIFEKYLEGRKDDAERWLTFMSMLATVFAIFFVYTGFKIDATKDKVDEASKRMGEIEKKAEETLEYATQLQYAMSFIIQKQYDKAIDALTVLSKEYYVLKDSRKINTCDFFLAHCYYERGKPNRNKDDLAMAVQYIDEAIEAPDHPFKNEIINEFKKLDNV